MANLIVRNIDDAIVKAQKQRASRVGWVEGTKPNNSKHFVGFYFVQPNLR